LSNLLEGSYSVKEGRIAGAFQIIRKERVACNIQKTKKTVDFRINVIDPFTRE